MRKEIKTCQNCKNNFVIEPEDFEFYAKINVPPPTFCPDCRLQRRLAWRNERTLYKRKCDAPGHNEDIISIYNKDSLFSAQGGSASGGKVYDPKYWWSDEWDPMDYGRDYDWNRPFFEQFGELMKDVPLMSLIIDYSRMINSDYNNLAGPMKNCYLTFGGEGCENCFYSNAILYSYKAIDNSKINKCELAYESFNCRGCFKIFFSTDCEKSNNLFFCKNCINCSDCFNCVNLKHKQYCILNKQYSKNEYLSLINKIDLGSYRNLLDKFEESRNFWIKFPVKYIHGRHNINVSGDYIEYSQNVFNSFEINNAQNCKYCQLLTMKPINDSYDYTEWGNNASLIYDSLNVGEASSKLKFCVSSFSNCLDLYYCLYCVNSLNLFGCISLRHKQYCILNKQYTKEEYEKLVPKIIEHMNDMPYIDKKGVAYKYGDFFPAKLSMFLYNESTAQEYFPLTKEQAINKGYNWKEPEQRNYQIDIKSEDLPDHIKDVKDDILNQIIGCLHQGAYNEQCTEAFKIIPQELEFYRKMNLPLPRLCPNCRHYQRIKQRNPLKLWRRKCQCAGKQSDDGICQNTSEHSHHKQEHCSNEFETSYAPERPEIVYCETCYLSEVV